MFDRADDLEQIHTLKARYCRFIDTKQWDRLATLFVPDAGFEGFGSAPTGTNVAGFVAGVAGRLADAITVHHCHMPDIVFFGPRSARAIWAMQDHLEWPYQIESRELGRTSGFCGYGFYEDEYRKDDSNSWKISFSRLIRLRLDPLPDACVFSARLKHDQQTDWLETRDL